MTTKKTARAWFEMLKEPYRSQAIEASEKWPNSQRKETYTSLVDAVVFDFRWDEPGVDWKRIHRSIALGETTYLAEPPTNS